MAHRQLGNLDEATQWYDKGTEWMDKYQSGDDELLRFRTEASQLLGKDAVDNGNVTPPTAL